MCRGDSSVKYTISYNYRLLICEGIFAFCKNVYIFAHRSYEKSVIYWK